MRIVIVGQGNGGEMSTWSGIPHHLGRSLEQLGARVEHVNADPGRLVLGTAVRALRAAGVRQPGASHGPELAALRTRWVARKLRGMRDAEFVQVDTGFRLPDGLRYVTLHDMTVAQALRVGWSDPALMGARPAAAWKRRDERICRSAVACCAASDWTATSLVRDYGIAADRVHTVGFGINAPTHRTGRDWAIPRFLFVGREWNRKNGATVLAAFRRLRADLPAATLTVVGDHPPISTPGVSDAGRLALASPQDRETLARLFEQSTCFVLPSKMEPFGIAHLEAGAAGIPSIGSRVGGAATAVGGGGVLVDPYDEDELLGAMRRLADPDTARSLGDRAAAHAAEFTWLHVAERVLEAIGGTSARARVVGRS